MTSKYDKYIQIISKSMHKRNEIMKSKAKELGLTDGEALALMFFYKHSTMNNAIDMVKECHVSKAYVSKIMLGLMAKKLITINTDTKDKRVRNIKLSKVAKDKAEQLCTSLEKYMDQVVKDLPRQQLDKIFKILDTNIDNI